MSNKKSIIDYGPLTPLIGIWHGNAGLDISPEPDGQEQNEYREEMFFEGVGEITNAEEQNLVALFYHQSIIRNSDNKKIHNETGYYSWDAENQLIIKSFSIPRGVAVTAGGSLVETPDGIQLQVSAAIDDEQWQIAQSPFMQRKALTRKYQFKLNIEDEKLNYQQTMELDIFGKQFQHTDKNSLCRIKRSL